MTVKKKPALKKVAPKKPAAVDELLAQYWANPDDKQLLRVWADSLQERGDPRGELIQLSLLDKPTPEQIKRRESLDKNQRGKLVGPAREFLREFEFGHDGLVARARCEADKLVAGLSAIEWINPRLSLKLTSLKDKAVLAKLGALSLERIYHISFQWGVLGSQGGSPMTDAMLATIAPAFRRVRHLAFDCGGYADNIFSPEGLRVLGNTVESLEYLSLRYFNAAATDYADARRRPLAPIDDYARVIAETPGFRTLKVVFLRGADPEILRALPNLAYAETAADEKKGSWWSNDHPYGSPADAAEIEAVKRGDFPRAR